MFTRCPECNTTFRVTAAQLKAATGKVRCSNCNTVFNSLESLEDDPAEDAAAASSTGKKSAKKAAKPAKKKAKPRKQGRSALASLFYLLMIPVLIAGLAVQYAFFQGHQLTSYYPQTKPYVEQLCHYLPCEKPVKRDLSKIETLEREMRMHPDMYKAMYMSAIIINKAEFTQPFPGLVLSIFDRQGKVVARRTFEPFQYLADENLDIKAGMAPKKMVYVKLEIVEPAHDNANFEIDFR